MIIYTFLENITLYMDRNGEEIGADPSIYKAIILAGKHLCKIDTADESSIMIYKNKGLPYYFALYMTIGDIHYNFVLIKIEDIVGTPLLAIFEDIVVDLVATELRR
jgi:hypothetical protein